MGVEQSEYMENEGPVWEIMRQTSLAVAMPGEVKRKGVKNGLRVGYILQGLIYHCGGDIYFSF